MYSEINLNVIWNFEYNSTGDITDIPKKFSAKMPVPGYWDDNLGSLKKQKYGHVMSNLIHNIEK